VLIRQLGFDKRRGKDKAGGRGVMLLLPKEIIHE